MKEVHRFLNYQLYYSLSIHEMAIYTKPEEVPRRKGSSGGSTFTKTCNGFIIRKRYTPKQPRTLSQFKYRQKFSSVSKFWHTLTPTQKTSFGTAEDTYTWVNSLGNVYEISANAMQNSTNMNRSTAELTNKTSGQNHITPITFTLAGGGANVSPVLLEMTLSPGTINADHRVFIHLSPIGNWQSENINLSALRIATVLQHGMPGIIDLLPFYETLFGTATPEVGQSVMVGVQSMREPQAIKLPISVVILHFL
jgi:hypothetical protein